jgi:hypothetical protein
VPGRERGERMGYPTVMNIAEGYTTFVILSGIV